MAPRQQSQPSVQQTPQATNMTVEIPTTITLKDVVVIATALVTIVSSWTFYTMRLSVQEQKLADYKVQVEKIVTDLDLTKRDLQDLKTKEQVLEAKMPQSRMR